jgi:hypothetical protein
MKTNRQSLGMYFNYSIYINYCVITSYNDSVAKALEFTLRYHDTYDVVADQSVLLNASEHLPMIDADTGVCELKLYVKALTLSMEGRPFCIEVRATEAGVESAFSTPITSV